MRRRRLLVSVPVLLASVAAGTSPVMATTGPEGGLEPRLVHRSQRAAPGQQVHQQAGTVAEGVVRRSVRLADPRLPHPSADPRHQLAAVDVTVDVVAQTLAATATYNAAPDPAATLGVAVGTWDGSSCSPAFVAGARGALAAAQLVDGTPVAATVSTQGNQVAVTTAAHPVLRDTVLECAYAFTLGAGDPPATLSSLYAEALTEAYVPVLEVEPDAQMVGARKGKWARLRLEVRNTSRGAASAVRLAASGKGIEVQPRTIDVGAVGDRTTEYVELKVRLKQPKGKKKAKKPKPRTLTLTVTDPAAAPATARSTVVVTPKPTTLRTLKGTYWWGWESTNLGSSAGWINHSVWFVDKKWAYTGWAEGRKPRCSAKVKDCRRYTYNARTGRLKIGKEKVTVTSQGFAFKHPGYGSKLRLEPLALPRKGTKLAVDLFHQNWSGTCSIMCTAYTRYLTMDRTGRFVEGGYSVGSWPGLGSTWGSAPADQRGTYKVVSTGVIEMSYADGTRKREVIGIQHDPSGTPNPAVAGVLLGDTNYYD